MSPRRHSGFQHSLKPHLDSNLEIPCLCNPQQPHDHPSPHNHGLALAVRLHGNWLLCLGIGRFRFGLGRCFFALTLARLHAWLGFLDRLVARVACPFEDFFWFVVREDFAAVVVFAARR